MHRRNWQVIVFGLFLALSTLSACTALPGGNVVESALVVHTAGSKKHTAAVQVPVTASEVFATIIRIIEGNQEWMIENRNDKAFLIEIVEGSQSLTAQVSRLGPERSLMYVWADAGASGRTGQELALTAVAQVCDELGVQYELVSY